MYSVSPVHVIGLRPSAPAALKPVPRAQATRPGASSATVAIAEAVTSGCLLNGTVTPVARPMRSVASAARASATHTSPYSAGESNAHMRA